MGRLPTRSRVVRTPYRLRAPPRSARSRRWRSARDTSSRWIGPMHARCRGRRADRRDLRPAVRRAGPLGAVRARARRWCRAVYPCPPEHRKETCPDFACVRHLDIARDRERARRTAGDTPNASCQDAAPDDPALHLQASAAAGARARGVLRSNRAPQSYEVVLVNDGSPDDTRDGDRAVAAVRALRALPSCNQANAGLAKARNAGLACSRGQRIVFIDDDVLPTPVFVEEHLRSDARYGDVIVRGAVINTASFDRLPPPVWSPANYSANYFWTSNVSLRRTRLDRAGGTFDESFAEYGWEDIELGMRLRALGTRGVFKRAVAFHYKPPPGRTNVAGMLRQVRAQARTAVQLARKHPHWRVDLAIGATPPQRCARQRRSIAAASRALLRRSSSAAGDQLLARRNCGGRADPRRRSVLRRSRCGRSGCSRQASAARQADPLVANGSGRRSDLVDAGDRDGAPVVSGRAHDDRVQRIQRGRRGAQPRCRRGRDVAAAALKPQRVRRRVSRRAIWRSRWRRMLPTCDRSPRRARRARIGYTYERRYLTRLIARLWLTDCLISNADPATCERDRSRIVMHEVNQVLALAQRAGATEIVPDLRVRDRRRRSRRQSPIFRPTRSSSTSAGAGASTAARPPACSSSSASCAGSGRPLVATYGADARRPGRGRARRRGRRPGRRRPDLRAVGGSLRARGLHRHDRYRGHARRQRREAADDRPVRAHLLLAELPGMVAVPGAERRSTQTPDRCAGRLASVTCRDRRGGCATTMTDTLEISVVVPTYNRLDTLRYVIPSLVAQDLRADAFEVIVADSNSNDGTTEYLAEIARTSPNVRHLPGPYTGRASARNAGIARGARAARAFYRRRHHRLARSALASSGPARQGPGPRGDRLRDPSRFLRRLPAQERGTRPCATRSIRATRKHLTWLYFMTGNCFGDARRSRSRRALR